MPTAIGIGALGAGRVLSYALLEPASRVTGLRVEAIASHSGRRLPAAFSDIPLFGAYDAIIHHPDIHAVYVALPNALHFDWTMAALRAGKHVLVEKPIGCNASETIAMFRCARDHRRVLLEGMHTRYAAAEHRLKELLDAGTIGELRGIEVSFRSRLSRTDWRFNRQLGGGATMDIGCYALSTIRRLLPGRKLKVRQARLHALGAEVDDGVDFELDCEGVPARVSCSLRAIFGKGWFTRLHGSAGTLTLQHRHRPPAITISTPDASTTEHIGAESSFIRQLRHFIDLVNTTIAPADLESQSIDVMRLIDDIYRAGGMKLRGEPRGRSGPASDSETHPPLTIGK